MFSIKAQSCTRYPTQDQAARDARLIQNDEEGAIKYIAEQRGSGWFIVAYEGEEEIGIL